MVKKTKTRARKAKTRTKAKTRVKKVMEPVVELQPVEVSEPAAPAEAKVESAPVETAEPAEAKVPYSDVSHSTHPREPSDQDALQRFYRIQDLEYLESRAGRKVT